MNKSFLKPFLFASLAFVFTFFILYLADPVLTGQVIRSLPADEGPSFASTYDDAYVQLLDAYYAEQNVTQTVNGSLWVPWYGTSSSCRESDLTGPPHCDVDVNGTVNCMVTDEFSQMGLLISMGEDEQRMREFVSTVQQLESDNGVLPSWRALRNGSRITACHPDINGNCDTASDADARILTALLTAAGNPSFSDQEQYRDYAARMAADFVEHDFVHSCEQTARGEICHFLAGGPGAASGGLGAWDFSFTGYYPDAIQAMLASCSTLDNETYCDMARNITATYLAAAEFNDSFRVPPGMAFQWVEDDGVMRAQCTNRCSPVQWDSVDAARSVAMCQNLRYADLAGVELPGLPEYCAAFREAYPDVRVPVAYYPNGSSVTSAPDSHFAASLNALGNLDNETRFREALDYALGKWSTETQSFDWSACHGVYFPAFTVRALGAGLGHDTYAFELDAPTIVSTAPDSVQTLPAGEPADFSIEANNADSITWTLDDETIGTGAQITITPPIGEHTLSVRAANEIGSVTHAWTFTAEPATFTSTDPAANVATQGEPVTFSVTYEGSDPIVWTIEGQAYANGTSQIEYDAPAAGEYTIVAQAGAAQMVWTLTSTEPVEEPGNEQNGTGGTPTNETEEQPGAESPAPSEPQAERPQSSGGSSGGSSSSGGSVSIGRTQNVSNAAENRSANQTGTVNPSEGGESGSGSTGDSGGSSVEPSEPVEDEPAPERAVKSFFENELTIEELFEILRGAR